MVDSTTSSGGSAAATSGSTTTTANQGGTVTSGGTATPTPAASGSTVSSGGTAATPAAPANGGNSTPASGAGTSGGQSTGTTTDANNNILVEVGVPFTYTPKGTIDETTLVVGYLPEGIRLDTTKGVLTGTPAAAGATTLTLVSPKNDPITVPLIVKPEIRVGFKRLYGDTTANVVLPAFRGPGDEPAIALVAVGGTGTYTFSIDGTSNGLSVDSKTGALSGNLPSNEGTVTTSIKISDGVGTVSVPVTFTVSKDIPIVYANPQPEKWWVALGDSTSTGLIPALTASLQSGVTYDLVASAYKQITEYVGRFIADPNVNSVPVMQQFLPAVVTFLGKIEAAASSDAKIGTIIKPTDVATITTLLALLNVPGGSSGLTANILIIAKSIKTYQDANNQGVASVISGNKAIANITSLTQATSSK